MPFSIDYSGPSHPLIITIEGMLTADGFVEIMEQIVNSNDYPANINAVYDLTQMSFDNITSDFLHAMVVRVKKYGKMRCGAKTAYVCPQDLQYGMARIWEVFVSDLPLETIVTRSMAAALSWSNE